MGRVAALRGHVILSRLAPRPGRHLCYLCSRRDSTTCKWVKAPVGYSEVMKACLNFGDILEVGRPQFQEMQRIGDAYASPDLPGACEAFTRQARIVEGILVQSYGIA